MKILIFVFLMTLCHYVYGTYSITVFGTNNCGFTSALRSELTKENIKFDYCNIDTLSCYYKLKDVVKEFPELAPNNYVDLPVVKVTVDGVSYGFVRPTINQIKNLITPTLSLLIENPVSNILTVNTTVTSIDIFSITGSKILHSDNNEIDIRRLVSGYYIAIINKNKIIKFLKF